MGAADAVRDVVFAIVELVTNPAMYGERTIELTLTVTDDEARIEVTDEGNGRPVIQPAATNGTKPDGLACASSTWSPSPRARATTTAAPRWYGVPAGRHPDDSAGGGPELPSFQDNGIRTCDLLGMTSEPSNDVE